MKLKIELQLSGKINSKNDLEVDTNNFLTYFNSILGEPVDIDIWTVPSTSLQSVRVDAYGVCLNIVIVINVISCSIYIVIKYYWKKKTEALKYSANHNGKPQGMLNHPKFQNNAANRRPRPAPFRRPEPDRVRELPIGKGPARTRQRPRR